MTLVLAFAEGSIQLVPDGTIFIHIALILLMIWVLNRTLFKPINRILELREKNTGGRNVEAQEIMAQVDEKLLRYETTLREARSEGYHHMEESRAAALAARNEQVNAVRADVAGLIEKQKSEIVAQSVAARSALSDEAKTLAEKISNSIMTAA
jgi:F-type H+-transporting ATPase subunit b